MYTNVWKLIPPLHNVSLHLRCSMHRFRRLFQANIVTATHVKRNKKKTGGACKRGKERAAVRGPECSPHVSQLHVLHIWQHPKRVVLSSVDEKIAQQYKVQHAPRISAMTTFSVFDTRLTLRHQFPWMLRRRCFNRQYFLIMVSSQVSKEVHPSVSLFFALLLHRMICTRCCRLTRSNVDLLS